jgi:uncharacterized protein (DUF305 family)
MRRGYVGSSVVFAVVVLTAMNGSANDVGQDRNPRKASDPQQHAMAGMMKPADDASYVSMMQMHHEHGIEMAKLAMSKSTRDEVKAFAKKTAADQQKDIDELHTLQASVNGPSSDANMHRSMMQSEHKQMMERLDQASGAEFDRMFIDMMIPHHQQAIDMSTPPEHFKAQGVKTFAQKTIDAQRREVLELQALKRRS